MLDIRFILANVELVKRNTQERYANADINKVVSLYERLRDERTQISNLQRQSNDIAARFRKTPAGQQEALRAEVAEIKQQLSVLKGKESATGKEYMGEMLKVPNIAADEAPQGKDETGNVPIKFFGKPPVFSFKPLDHMDLGKRLNLVDFEAGAKVAGSKFYFLKNAAVILEFALVRYALDHAIKHGFTVMTTPELARDDIITASGFAPRGPESQIYSLAEDGLSLIGTSEITIGGYLSNTVLQEDELPVKLAAASHCFRTEAGSHGRESRGLYRVHQFTKVEMYQFTLPSKSHNAHEELLSIEEEFYQGLELPYRVLLMCRGDLGTPAYKKYDIEAWMPSLGESGAYREVTSASNCTDFQARRLNVRYKEKSSGKTEFVHTLNGTAVATTRTMLAIFENYQQADGSILIPKVLQPYVGYSKIEK